MNNVEWYFLALATIWVLLVGAHYARRNSQALSKLFLPGSIIAGFVALIAGPDVIGRIFGAFEATEVVLSQGLIPAEVFAIWHALPGLLINVVFASLFLGKTIPRPRTIWRRAAPVVTYGQTIAWGQYVIGFLLVIFLLEPIFDVNPMAAALIEIGFEGGHGTAAGLIPVFEELDFMEGADLALGLATVGLLSAIVTGTIMINWAARTNRLDARVKPLDVEAVPEEMAGLLGKNSSNGQSAGEDQPIDPLSLHLGFIGVAVLVGWLCLETLVMLERYTWGRFTDVVILTHVPLFPFAMIGGVVVQIFLARKWGRHIVDRQLVNRIAGTALDIIIVAALATLSLTTITANMIPFVLLAVAGVAWNVLGFLWLAPRLIPSHWFENGIPNFGQSMGMTVTGILLFRMTDPENRSHGLENFGYKQLLFEPIVGGGLFTAAALPLIFQFGAPAMLFVTATLMIAWLSYGLLVLAPASDKS